MIGSIIAAGIRLTTVPVKIMNATADVVMGGGNGSKRSRKQSDNPLTMLEEIGEACADAVEEIDKKGTP